MQQDFKKETIDGSLARVAVLGLHDSRSLHPALEIAIQLAGDKRVAVIDANYQASKKYAAVYDFDAVHLNTHHPDEFVKFIQRAQETGKYGALVINDLSHAWDGPRDGMLKLQKGQGGRFVDWKDVAHIHEGLIHAIKGCGLHLVATLRAKEKRRQEGKGKDAKIIELGIHPIQRQDLADIFEIVGLYQNGSMKFTRTDSCRGLREQIFHAPFSPAGQIIVEWLQTGTKLTPEAAERLKLLNDLESFAADFGIIGKDLRNYGRACPDVQSDDPKTWTAEKCERIKQYIKNGGAPLLLGSDDIVSTQQLQSAH